MIGQKILLSKIDKMISSFPKFTIIVGAKGSGKKTIATQICRKLGLMMVKFGTGIDEVREIIDLSYSFQEVYNLFFEFLLLYLKHFSHIF